MKLKLDVVKVITIAGTALSIVGTLLSGWASDKKTDKIIEDKIKDQLGK